MAAADVKQQVLAAAGDWIASLDVPVLVVTSDVQESTREECFERGAAEVLYKPVNEDKLLVTIANFVGPAGEAAAS